VKRKNKLTFRSTKTKRYGRKNSEKNKLMLLSKNEENVVSEKGIRKLKKICGK
jgi:hypothetical protein